MVGDRNGNQVTESPNTSSGVFIKSVQINSVSGLSVEEHTQINELD